MANPLKVLTQLTASREAQFAEVVEMQKTVTVSGGDLKFTNAAGEISGSGAFKNAGAAQLGSTLAVAGNASLAAELSVVGAADLQSTLDVAGAADLQSTLAVAGNADLNGELDVQEAANFQDNVDVAGYMKAVGEISGSAALNIGGAAHVVGAAQFDSSLSVDGNADVDGTLSVVGNISSQASASIAGDLDVNGLADIAGNLDVHGNAVIYGDLEVKGTMTTIESTTVTVADANIQLATVASPTDSTADGAGITILGATNKTFQWNNDGHGFTSSEDMNLAAGKVYKIDGVNVAQIDEDGRVVIGKGSDPSSNGIVKADANFAALKKGESQVTVEDSGVTIANGLDLLGNLTTNANASIDQHLSVGNNLGVGSDAIVSGSFQATYFNDQFQLEAIIPQTGNAYVKVNSDLTASAGLDLTGNAHIAGELNVDSNASFISAVSVSGELTVDYKFVSHGPAELSSSVAILGAVDMDSTLNVDGNADLQAELHVVGAADFDSTMNVDGQADFQAAANFHDDVAMDAALNLSGSAFINITTPVVSGKYNVNDAIRALDAKAGQQASNINSNYAALRYLSAANFDANGMAAFTSSFAAADIEQVSVDVLVQAGGSGPWTNDLLSIQVKAAGSYVGFEISAPAMGASDKVRIIAVKESGSLA